MAGIDWLRLWHDMPNDPKWRTVARASGEPIALVLAMYVHLLVDASHGVTQCHGESRTVTRGVTDVTDEDIASALDVTEDAIRSIRDAMQGRVLDGDRLTGWERRQPKREDAGNPETGAKSSAERKREQRERERQERENGSSHEASRDVTKSHAREDKEKEKEKSNKTEEVPSSLSEAEIAFEFPLNDGTVYQLSLAQVAEFQELYPAANVDGELRACLGWNRANPKKRKTRTGILKHINTWLADKQNNPRPVAAVAMPQKFDPVAHVNRNRFAGVK